MIVLMSYKIIVLAASAGGKSTLLRYLRENTDLNIAEMDEEILKNNNNEWPLDNDYKDKTLVPQIVAEIIKNESVIYLASYIPETQLEEAIHIGFKVVLLDLSIEELNKRNKERMKQEEYADASSWLQIQVDTFERLKKEGIFDRVIQGSETTEKIANEIKNLLV